MPRHPYPDGTPGDGVRPADLGQAGRTSRGRRRVRADEEETLAAIAEDLGTPQEIIRQVRQAHREAVSEARTAMLEAARAAREAEREVARQLRTERVTSRGRGRLQRETGEPDTRERIQKVALELFTANGYEATSLREIAERLGVTKAALYYHFKTKDDIIDSLVSDRLSQVEELIAWADSQPRGNATRREALRRYSDMLHKQGHHDVMRFFERNQSSMTQHKAGVMMRSRMVQLLDALIDRDAPLAEQIRCSLAFFALHSTWFTIRDPNTTDEQRREAALEVALDLIATVGS